MGWLSRKFSRRLALAFSLLLVGTMGVTDLLLTRALKAQLVEDLSAELRTGGRLIRAGLAPSALRSSVRGAAQAAALSCAQACRCRVTLIRPDGTVVGDSEVPDSALAGLENHAERSEVREALAGREACSTRYSATRRQEMLYAAVPAAGGVVRTSLPLEGVRRKVAALRRTIVTVTLCMVLAAILAALWLSSSITRPVRELSAVAARLTQGEHGARVRPGAPGELGQLAATLNMLAEKVQTAIRELSREKTQLAAILDSMVEAVAAVDAAGRIVAVNPAFSRITGTELPHAGGRPFMEVLRHTQLNALIGETLKEGRPRSEEVRVLFGEELVFEAHAVPMSLEGRPFGALLVLHDITRLRRLEGLRRDFVANVSHEVRTPLASIKAFAETLRSGGVEDVEHRMEFLDAIEKDADRMTRLVEDLLDLSAIESGRRAPRLEPVHLRDAVQEAAAAVMPLAKRKEVKVESLIPGDCPPVRADKDQLGQVLLNLIDNAVKFNKDGGSVTISVSFGEGKSTVTVEDTGRGIPSEDLPRVFERFYRVDKARSRELGGTGLGLAIVKHIVEAHGGEVGVESRLGVGSTFRFSLPAVG